MNYRLLSKVCGLLLFIVGAAMLLCLAYAVWDHERKPGRDAVEAFAASVALTWLAGAACLFLGRGSGRELLRKEAIAVVGLGWLLCGAVGMLPYLLSEPRLTAPEAWFESMSGFTTTGATVITDLNAFPRAILLWRSLTQWLGGLGILVLFVALLSYLGVGSKSLFRHESSARSSEGLEARVRSLAKRLWLIYVAFTAVCCLGLVGLGMGFYESLAHALTSISTGGFSPRNESVAAYGNVWIELWLMLFMGLGGISFMLFAMLLRGRWGRWKKEEETKVYLLALACASLLIWADLILVGGSEKAGQSLRDACFQVISIMTTTGYVTADFNQWPPLSQIVLILLMSLGGCAGSTAGGIKISRWILFFKIVRLETIAAFRPNQVVAVHLNGIVADDLLKMQTVFFVALAGVTVSLSTALVSLLEPQLDMISSFSSVAACLFNIGPGLGAVGPTRHFAHLSAMTQVLLSMLMVLGRLEFFGILVLFMPSLWRKY